MKHIFLLVLMAFGFISGQTQTLETDVNLNEKYYLLKQRFKERFIRLGSCERGYGVPVNHRREKMYWAGDSGVYVNWTDGTVLIGQYLNSLALEYDRLSENRQPIDSTLSEIYFVLNAVYRLDASSGDYFYYPEDYIDAIENVPSAEEPTLEERYMFPIPACTYTGTPIPCINDFNYTTTCDGFFIRDDVYYNFKNKFGARYMSSEREPQNSGNCNGKEASGDQSFSLLTGLYMIAKFCDGVSYNGLNFSEFAKFEAQKIFDMICWDYDSASDPTPRKGWLIQNPHNDYRLASQHRDGGSIDFHAFPLKKFVENDVIDGSAPPDPLSYSASFVELYSLHDVPYLLRPVSDWFVLQNVIMGDIWNRDDVQDWAWLKRKEYYYLHDRIIRGAPTLPFLGYRLNDNAYAKMLDTCACHGKFGTNHPDSTIHRYGWNVWDRNVSGYCSSCQGWSLASIALLLLLPETELVPVDWEISIDPLVIDHFKKGTTAGDEFPPIDYFNIHNAYNKVYRNADDYYNCNDMYVWRTHPYVSMAYDPPVVAGLIGLPRTYRSLKGISSDARMLSASKAEFIAGFAVDLNPGFTVDAGAEFDAWIEEKPIGCSGGEVLRMGAPVTGPHVESELSLELLANVADLSKQVHELSPEQELLIQQFEGGFNAPSPAEVEVISLPAEIAPNPSNGQFVLRLQSRTDLQLTLTLTDMRGVQMAEMIHVDASKGSNTIDLDWQGLPDGMYFLSISFDGGQQLEKVIIQH